MGNPDLTSSERPRGLVIFPAATAVAESPPRPVLGWLARWRVFVVTLVVGACVVIAVALILSAGSSNRAAPPLPPLAPSANPGSVPHP